jgi:hypothetical protein
MINNFVGFIQVNGRDNLLSSHLHHLGKLTDLETTLADHQVEEVIIAIESSDHDRLQSIMARIDNGNIRIRVLPDMYSILAGSVDMTNIYGALLIEINPDVMPYWQRAVKRGMDIVFSFIALLLLIPFFIFSSFAVKLSSPGPIFFLQDRVGRGGKRFKIIKFRTICLRGFRVAWSRHGSILLRLLYFIFHELTVSLLFFKLIPNISIFLHLFSLFHFLLFCDVKMRFK